MSAPAETSPPRLFLIDGYALIYRAFFAMIARPLTTSKGENTSAAWGFTNFLIKVLEEHRPEYLGVVLDAGSSERHEIFPEYKATREKMPTELEASIPRVREIIAAYRVPVLELEGYEADDVIGTLARQAAEAGIHTVVVSGDKDFYQLVSERISLLNPGRGGGSPVDEEWVDLRNAHERLGVPPEHVTDYLGLIGDSSDNIPGVRGIGPKTAIKLIEEHGSLEQILDSAGEISGKRARESLQASRDDALLSKRLVTIRRDLPVPLELERLGVGEPDRATLRRLFLEVEFHTLVRDHAAPDAPAASQATYRALASAKEVESLLARAREAGRVAIAAATTRADPLHAELCALALATEPGEAFYLPFGHCAPAPDQSELLPDEENRAVDEPANLPPLLDDEMASLAALLEDPSVSKVGHDLKQVLLVLRRAGVELRGADFDTSIASYLLEPGRREHGLEGLALQHFDHRTTPYEEVAGKGRTALPFAEVAIEDACRFLAEDADLALRFAERFAPELERLALEPLFRTVEMPLVRVLAEMEWNGIRIDEDFFAATSTRLRSELRAIEKEIFAEAGTEFNIGSNPQLREILYERLDLPVIKRTKTGPSTDVSVLEALAAQGHRLPTLLMEYRQLEKLRNTYVDALPQLINPETGRIHTSFNQTVASTGRLSSSDPNLQNIPIRTEQGAEIRRGFIPAEGNAYLSADYSQIELRVLAHYSGDPAFVEAFREGEDIHRQTAALVFGVPREEVRREMRDRAKTVNFAIIYGVGPFSLSSQLGVSVAEAKEFIAAYFARFPDVRAYLDEQIERAREQGYVETLSGRRRYIPEIRSRNYNIRSFGERAATNAPIQGSSADLLKMAMIAIQAEIGDGGWGAKMLLTVHDELLFEAPAAEIDTLQEMVTRRMEGAAELRVPLRVATGTGANWLECK